MSTQPNEVASINYDLVFLRKPLWILLLFLILLIALFLNFPLGKKIDQMIFGALSANPSCPIKIDDYKINVLPLPHLAIHNMNIPKRCLGAQSGSISIPLSKAYLRGPSLFPLGVSFKLETELNKNPIDVYTTFGINHHVIELKENKLSLDKLSPFIPNVVLSGIVLADAHIEFEDSKLSVLNLKLQSETFVLPSQEIQSFLIKRMNIKNLFLTAVTEGKKLKLDQFVIGDENSPIRADFKGDILLNQKNIKTSSLNLVGEVAFSDEFLTENFLVKSYMNQFDKKDSFYQLKVQGPLSRPSVSSNRKK